MSGHSLIINNVDPSKTYFYDCEVDSAFSTNPTTTLDVEVQNGVITRDYGATAYAWTLDSNESNATMLICLNAGGNSNIIAPAKEGKMYIIKNNSSKIITIKTATSTGVTIADGKKATVISNGNDFEKIAEI